ncbi:MAG: hypothetical protein Q8L60_08000 [Gammaproteobacteria bacterium]|nr:hypothetical protein [Gammaproteobacteria bacterium]MDP2140091.1 hypothetical protein [Gammaproteobacteria bacterium]MDP2347653.1 hypothetical protein [Gammaproteobacteria bacterium]
MSKDTIQSTDLAIQLDPLDMLRASVKRQKLILLALTITCALALLTALTAVGMLMMQDNQVISEQVRLIERTRLIEEQIQHFTVQAETLLVRSNETNIALTSLREQVGNIDVNDQTNVVIRLQRILIRQEQDYRNFLTSLENGLYNFHMMIPHSRGWWEGYKQELVESSELSKARENYVMNLRNN